MESTGASVTAGISLGTAAGNAMLALSAQTRLGGVLATAMASPISRMVGLGAA
jgi:hypothetical protein